MNMINEQNALCLEICRIAHEGQVDKAGAAYRFHPMRVALRLRHGTEAEQCAALLHDVLEDSVVSEGDLREMGVSEEVISIVRELTKTPSDTSYIAYIQRLVESGNVSAMRVKLADLYDNTSPGRVRYISDSHLNRYKTAIGIISNALGVERYQDIDANV